MQHGPKKYTFEYPDGDTIQFNSNDDLDVSPARGDRFVFNIAPGAHVGSMIPRAHGVVYAHEPMPAPARRPSWADDALEAIKKQQAENKRKADLQASWVADANESIKKQQAEYQRRADAQAQAELLKAQAQQLAQAQALIQAQAAALAQLQAQGMHAHAPGQSYAPAHAAHPPALPPFDDVEEKAPVARVDAPPSYEEATGQVKFNSGISSV